MVQFEVPAIVPADPEGYVADLLVQRVQKTSHYVALLDCLISLSKVAIDKVRDYQKLKINREIERAIQKEEELKKETEKHGTCE